MIALAVFLSACCVFNTAKRPEPRATLGEQLEQKTVAMVTYMAPDEDGDIVPSTADAEGAFLAPYCSGVWVSRDTFITAGHCVANIGKPQEQKFIEQVLESMNVPKSKWEEMGLKPWNPEGQNVSYSSRNDVKDTETRSFRGFHSATVRTFDDKHDLALVRATPSKDDPLPDHSIASIASSSHVGDEVHVMGHTLGLWWSYTHGYVAQIRPGMPNVDGNKMDTIQISAPVYFGNSGGGAFNSNGELMGVISWIKKGPSLGFMASHTEVDRLLRHERIIR